MAERESSRGQDPRVELVRSAGLADTVDYAYAAVVDRLVFTAGACPLDAHGRVVGAGNVAGQTEQTMANLVTAWGVVRAHFGDHDPPSTLLGVQLLGYPDQLVEVDAVAVRR